MLTLCIQGKPSRTFLSQALQTFQSEAFTNLRMPGSGSRVVVTRLVQVEQPSKLSQPTLILSAPLQKAPTPKLPTPLQNGNTFARRAGLAVPIIRGRVAVGPGPDAPAAEGAEVREQRAQGAPGADERREAEEQVRAVSARRGGPSGAQGGRRRGEGRGRAVRRGRGQAHGHVRGEPE